MFAGVPRTKPSAASTSGTPAAKAAAPYGLYVHGASDTAGAVRAVKSIVTGLGWAEVVNPVVVIGPVDSGVERRCYELGATVAANLSVP